MPVQPKLFFLPAQRRALTGESLQLARQRLIEQRRNGDASLVPNAADYHQAEFEAEVLSVLAVEIGPHRPANLGGVYGIRSVSPTSACISLDVTDDAVVALARGGLPRAFSSAAGQEQGFTGVAGLRFETLSKGRIRLYRLDRQGEIILNAARRSWNASIRSVTAELSEGTVALWDLGERAVVERRSAAEAPPVGQMLPWSRSLRRIALWRNENEVDFVTRPPTPDLAKSPARLADAGSPRSAGGLSVACFSRQGAAGRSTTLREVAGAWSRQGLKVLLADLDPQQSQAFWARAAGAEPVEGPSWSYSTEQELLLGQSSNGGELRLLVGLGEERTAGRLLRKLDEARLHADVILLDVAPGFGYETSRFAAEFADVAITCFRMDESLFGQMKTEFSDRYRPIGERRDKRREMFVWLDAAFYAYLEIMLLARPEPPAPDTLLAEAIGRSRDSGRTLADELEYAETYASDWTLDEPEEPREPEEPHQLDEVDEIDWWDAEDFDESQDFDAGKLEPAWVENLRGPFIISVAAEAARLFGSVWDEARWTTHSRAHLFGDETATRELMRAEEAEEPQAGDVFRVYRRYDDQTVIASLNDRLARHGLHPDAAVAGRVAAAIPIEHRGEAPWSEVVEQQARLAGSCVYPVLKQSVPWDEAVAEAAAAGRQLAIAHPDHPVALQLAAVASELFELITR